MRISSTNVTIIHDVSSEHGRIPIDRMIYNANTEAICQLNELPNLWLYLPYYSDSHASKSCDARNWRFPQPGPRRSRLVWPAPGRCPFSCCEIENDNEHPRTEQSLNSKDSLVMCVGGIGKLFRVHLQSIHAVFAQLICIAATKWV